MTARLLVILLKNIWVYFMSYYIIVWNFTMDLKVIYEWKSAAFKQV